MRNTNPTGQQAGPFPARETSCQNKPPTLPSLPPSSADSWSSSEVSPSHGGKRTPFKALREETAWCTFRTSRLGLLHAQGLNSSFKA